MGTTGQSITLANSIIGVGILAMPFCFQKCGVLLATLILLSMGLVSRLCCHFLLKSALLARRRNFEFLAFHVFGSGGKMAVELGIIGFLMGTCIAYFVVVGDLGPQIISKMFNINQSDILRTSIMVIVSLVCVLPLGLLRNVDSLSNVSAATIGFYFCLVIKVITEAASQLLTVDWGAGAELWKPEGVLQCVPIFSMALFCQTQLFEIFESMPTLSLEKMNVVTKNAINICTAVYFTLGLFGYVAFGKHDISGNVLMSLSPTMANDVIKLGFVMSLAFSFPLIIFPCRASLYSFLYRKAHPSQHDHIINHSIPETTFRCITVCIIAGALFVSLLIPNIELVLGLVGSTIGVLICVVFPAACFVNVTFKNTNERVLAKVVLVLGLGIMVLGTYANLQAAERAPDKYDGHITQERIDQIVEDFFQSRKLEDGGSAIKTPEKVDQVPKEEVKLIKDAVADSEVQPPNPVPPDSPQDEVLTEKEDMKKLKKAVKEVKQEVDRVSETHPKNLNKNTEAKITNGEIKKKEKSDTQIKEGIKLMKIEEDIKEMKIKEEIKQLKIKEEIKQMSNQQKIDLLKQAQLAETIKQHGEEQKELIKEQKEILDNILKTKQEIQLDKNEAKKIAVESIQKIANVAIQSLSAVSEQPAGLAEKKMEPGETANEAVQKIAEVAVEAIKEIKDKPIEVVVPLIRSENVAQKMPEGKPVPVQGSVNEVKPNEPIAQNIQNLNINLVKPQETVVENSKNIQPVVQNTVLENNNNEFKKPEQLDNNQPLVHNAAVDNNVAVDNHQNNNPLIPNNEAVQNNIHVNKPQQIGIQPVANNHAVPTNNKANKLPVNLLSKNIASNIPAKVDGNSHVDNLAVAGHNAHSHSPDEPQSYKQGEDSQKKPDENANILNNVPLPLAINGNNFKAAEIKHEVFDKPIEVQDGDKQPIINIDSIDNSVPVRQKREVVDCANKVTLRAEDREICKTLLNSRENKSPELLPKVDLNDALPKELPLVNLNMVHQVRSLKSYNEEKRR